MDVISILVTGGVMLLLYAVVDAAFRKNHPTRLEYRVNDRSKFIVERCPKLRAGYSSPWWLRNRHFHALLSILWPLLAPVRFTREAFKVKDGGHVALDWSCPDGATDESPIIIGVHGIAGDSSSGYLRSLCRRALDKGFRTVVFHKRGHGGLALATPHLPPFGDTSDFAAVLASIRERYPRAPLLGIGFSGGTGQLAGYLGSTGSRALLTAAIVVSAGYDPPKIFCSDEQRAAHEAEAVARGEPKPLCLRIPYFYDRLLTFELKRMLRFQMPILRQASHIDLDRALRAKRMFQIDETVFAPINGINDLTTYWERNDPMQNFRSIDVPFLCLNAEDDPVCIKEMIPYDLVHETQCNIVAGTREGSHCAFIDGMFSNGAFSSWADKVALEFFEAVLEWEKLSTTPRMDDSAAMRD